MKNRLILLGVSMSALGGCIVVDGGQHRERPQRVHPVATKPAPAPASTPAPAPALQQVHVPPGHMPPPGKCRHWYPGRPPGHQPAIGDCAELARYTPPGAVLVSGGAAPAPVAQPSPAPGQVYTAPERRPAPAPAVATAPVVTPVSSPPPAAPDRKPQRGSSGDKPAPSAAPAAAPAPAPAQTASARDLKIPPGHMPPAGKCRAWFPGQPPGKQPPVGNCADIEKNLPRGAVLVRG